MKRFLLALLMSTFAGCAIAADCSGTIATGGTAQNAITAPVGYGRINGFTVCNVDAAAGSGEPLWINPNGTATAGIGSIPLSAPTTTTFAATNNCYTTNDTFTSQNGLSVLAATSTHKFTCWRW